MRMPLFTRSGEHVAVVEIAPVDERWPLVVRHEGRCYALVDGRYVQSDEPVTVETAPC